MRSTFKINRNRVAYPSQPKAAMPQQALTRIGCLLLFAAMLFIAFTPQAQTTQTVSADFGGRTASTPVVPKGIFAVNGVGSTLSDRSGISALTTAGLTGTRFWVPMASIFASPTPNFSTLDKYVTTMQNAGLHPIAVIYGTPPSLGSSACSAPSSVSQWGQMAASVVAHLDQKFPGVVQDYEIWNEPELATSLRISNDTTRLDTYISMFGNAATAMHAQANADGEPIRTGGPTISTMSVASVWVPALLSNPSTAPYVDFVSFHLYLTGQINLTNGMQWSDLYSITQSSTTGLGYYYNQIDSLVRSGKQPNAASTPIYLSEYNDNWAHALDPLRNDPTYGPLWNSLAVTDFLNVSYNGASALPSRLAYFMSSGQYFCLLGQWDTNMDCNPAALNPYPQYYAFKLFASPDFLDLQGGGQMAAWVSPGNTKSGLSATAFYTDTANNIVIINPTPTAYNAVPVSLINPGITSATGTLYLLNSSNPQITTQSLSLSSSGSTYNTTVNIPAYSTVAVSLTGTIAPSTTPVTPPPPPPAPVPPVPVLNVTSTSGTAPLVVNIDSSQSQGGNGATIVGRTINFGDGTWVNSTVTTTHTYSNVGSYTVTLTLKNDAGLTASTTSTVTVKVAAALIPANPPPTALQSIPVTPCRVADTRNPTGPFGGPVLAANTTREFDIPQSICNIPSTALAYSLNVTVVPSGPLGYLTLWPTGQTKPTVSTLNSDGRIKANAAIVPTGTNGGVDVYVTNTTHVVLDIDGYFVPSGTDSALAFYPVTPCRIVDTRNPPGLLGGRLSPPGSAGLSQCNRATVGFPRRRRPTH
jgi:PKD repeat protein